MRLPLAILILLAASLTAKGQESHAGLKVPPGFKVTLYADDALATDISSLTIDARGRVVVSGPGYVKILEDSDRDGRADRAILFSDRPRTGAQGMYFDGNDLIAAGDGGV